MNPTVFVVDDYPHMTACIRRQLRPLGVKVKVVEFQNPQQALLAAQATPPHVLVTDVMMPELTGLELAAGLRRQSPRLKTILISTAEQQLAPAPEQGLVQVLLKPWPGAELLDAVQTALELVLQDFDA